MYLLNKQNLFVENIVIKKYLNIIKKNLGKILLVMKRLELFLLRIRNI